MGTIEATLTDIKDRMARAQRELPERLLTELMEQAGPAVLSEWRTDIMDLVDQFQKKRRRRLLEVYRARTGAVDGGADIDAERPAESYVAIGPDSDLVIAFRRALDQLRQRHIFQWSTFYRDCLTTHLGLFFDEMRDLSPSDSGDALADPLAAHAREVFTSGYDYACEKGHGHDDALRKAVNGLSRFLALPLEFYTARSSSVSDSRSVLALRLLLSSALSGILRGCASASFGTTMGRTILPRYQRQWMHSVAFLIPHHVERVIDGLESGPLSDGLRTSVLPLLDALQKFFDRRDESYFPLPVTGQYSWNDRRLDVAVHPPPDAEPQRLIEASAFLEEGFVSTAKLEDAVRRQVKLVIAPLRPDLQRVVNESGSLEAVVVPVEAARSGLGDPGGAAREERRRRTVADHAFKCWDNAVFALRSRLEKSSPITYNFAREFPLTDPGKAKFFHVARTSVRDLLRTFERRNGVRLWCSVRRSGKTTACLDLGSTTGDSTIVPQTCGQSQTEDATRFYERVSEAVSAGRMVSRTFVTDVVMNCAPIDVENRRIVLVLDEYETLFEHLDAAAEERLIRYNVVQPILNQLVSFSYDNLLVFLGQKPDAHFILMDQNQLAPFVKQDPFPLFEHRAGTATGEFADLVAGKILAARIECTAGFLDALFAETAGHPYLTVNVVSGFVDWLIDQRRPQLGLRVESDDFEEFADHGLDADRIGMSHDYEFFKHAVALAMSERGFKANPWLFATYWVLRQLSSDGSSASKTFGIERSRFPELMREIPVPDGGRLPDHAEILRSASQANFLSYDDRTVTVKIRTLGRIAAAVRPALG